ncbi:MAG: hypothetical protein HYT87_09780 [Nitrospirae bacterium]|nr:hypothetical protein [Nitrospirota bacterium]
MRANFHWAGGSEAADVVARERALLSGMGSGEIEPVPWMVCSAFRSEFVAAGAYQRHDSALNLDACARMKTPIMTRWTGGISTRWGPGVLHMALFLPNASAWTETPMDRIINRYVRGILSGLGSMGLEAAYNGKEFLWANGKHIGYLSFEVAPGGAVLFECLLAMTGPWVLPKEFLAYPAGESYLSGGFPSACLKEFDLEALAPDVLARKLAEGFERRFGVSFEEAKAPVSSAPAVEEAPRRTDDRLRRGGVGRARSRVSIGFLEVYASIENERFSDLEVCGDFLADSDGIRRLREGLLGRGIRNDDVEGVVRSIFDQKKHVLLGARLAELTSTILAAGEAATESKLHP